MTVLYENERYTVIVVDDALDEDNRSRCAGYGIINKATGIREATGLVFGETRWRADQFNNMIGELDAKATVVDEEEALVDMGIEDVVPN